MAVVSLEKLLAVISKMLLIISADLVLVVTFIFQQYPKNLARVAELVLEQVQYQGTRMVRLYHFQHLLGR